MPSSVTPGGLGVILTYFLLQNTHLTQQEALDRLTSKRGYSEMNLIGSSAGF